MIGYHDPRFFYKSSGYKEEYAEAIHLCATKSLARAVRLLAEQKEALNKEKVIDALDFIKTLLGSWSNPERKLAQYAHLSEILRNKREELPEDDRDILRAFRLNQYDVLQTMRLLTEINETPSVIQKHVSEREEYLFVNLWDEMEKEDISFKHIREKVNVIWQDKKQFTEEVLEALDKLTGEKPLEKRILLHGFYFISPIQHKVFTLLKEAGFELIFINLYNQHYSSVFQSVEEFISTKYGWVDTKDWIIDKKTSPGYALGRRFASSFEGNTLKKDDEQRIQKVLYEDFYEFLSDFEREENSKKFIYLSPIPDPINNRIKEYHPNIFKEDRHLLSYPAGQFLFHLHNMWDDQHNELVLSEQALMDCFSSGWLIDKTNQKNAVDYTDVLYELLPFFQLCKTVPEWEEQTKNLVELRKETVHPFEKHTPKGGPTDRFHQILENPFVWLSYLNVKEEEIKQVTHFINHLLEIARFLFKKSEKVSLNEHFKRLKIILESGLSETSKSEDEIIQQLLNKLSTADNNEKFLVQDLSEAIALYLGGKLEDEGDKEEKNNSNLRKIFSLEDIDGKVIEAALYNKSIHICGLDENNLPQSSTFLPWPVTRRTLESMSDNKSLSMVLLREELKPQISRYLFYSFASFTKDGVVSWMKNWDGKDNLEESFYLMLLGLDLKIDERAPEQRELSDKQILKREDIEASEVLTNYPEHTFQEYLLCPRRFFYSFLVQDHATFHSNFHHELLFGNFIKTLPIITRQKKEKISAKVKELFPQWSTLKRQYLIENNERYISPLINIDKREKINYDEEQYSVVQKQLPMILHRGSKKIVDKQREPYLEENWYKIFGPEEGARVNFERTAMSDNHAMFSSSPSTLCRFCPHIDHCPDAYYPVDDEQRKLQSPD